MSIRIKLFGPLVDAAGRSEIEISNVGDTFSLKQEMLNRFPSMKNYNFLISVDKRIFTDNKTINSENEIALLPPFAGG